jgi:hypothetical protein
MYIIAQMQTGHICHTIPSDGAHTHLLPLLQLLVLFPLSSPLLTGIQSLNTPFAASFMVFPITVADIVRHRQMTVHIITYTFWQALP